MRRSASRARTHRLRLLVHNMELENMAIRDELTQLFNRRYLFERLERELQTAKGFQRPLALITIEVTSLDHVNHTYGHAAGDQLLAAFGQFLLEFTRSTDVPARMSSNRFGIILPDTIGEHAVVTAERLRSVVEAHDFAADCPELAGRSITISIGGAICPDDAVTKENLIGKADRALAEAERAGKNRSVFSGLSSAGGGE